PSVKTTRSGESTALTVAIADIRLLSSLPETIPNEYAYFGITRHSSDQNTMFGITSDAGPRSRTLYCPDATSAVFEPIFHSAPVCGAHSCPSTPSRLD